MVSVTADPEEAFSGASFVFSAIRVGGDQGRVIDEQVALRRGLVGQETTGPGGAAMALRTIPVVLSYCERLARCSPRGSAHQLHQPGRDHHPSDLLVRRGAGRGCMRHAQRHLGAAWGRSSAPSAETVSFAYSGLNHLGWISSFRVEGRSASAS